MLFYIYVFCAVNLHITEHKQALCIQMRYEWISVLNEHLIMAFNSKRATTQYFIMFLTLGKHRWVNLTGLYSNMNSRCNNITHTSVVLVGKQVYLPAR